MSLASSLCPRATRVAMRAPARRFGVSASAPNPVGLNTLRPAVKTASPGGSSVLRMIMFGKPGAGKGTLSSRLVKKYNIHALSTGDLLRQHIAERTEVGLQAEEIIARGELLPDEIMLQVLTSKLNLLHNQHWILDGFPRTLGQGQMLDGHLRNMGSPLSLVVNLDVSDDAILSRIQDRWIHPSSGRVYNYSYNPPNVAGRDNETGEPLVKRPDDNPEIFGRRLKQFYASTSPLLAFYAAQPPSAARLVSCPGETSDQIWPQLEAAVRATCPFLSLRTAAREALRRSSINDALAAEAKPPRVPGAHATEGFRIN